MNVGTPLIPNREPAETVKPCKAALDDPTVTPEMLARLDPAASDARHDAPQLAPESRDARIVRLVSVQLVWPTTTTPAMRPRDRRNRVEQLFQHFGVGDVGRGQADGERQPVAVYEDMVLAARPTAVRRVRPDLFGAPPFAGTFEPSSAARDQSIFPFAPSS